MKNRVDWLVEAGGLGWLGAAVLVGGLLVFALYTHATHMRKPLVSISIFGCCTALGYVLLLADKASRTGHVGPLVPVVFLWGFLMFALYSGLRQCPKQ